MLEQERGAIDAILAKYHVPLTPGQDEAGEDARPSRPLPPVSDATAPSQHRPASRLRLTRPR